MFVLSVFFIFEKEKNYFRSFTVTLVFCITTSCLLGVTVADVTGKRNLCLSKCLYQYSPMCTSYLCFTCDRDYDNTTQENIMCMLKMPVLIQCTCEMYLSTSDWRCDTQI